MVMVVDSGSRGSLLKSLSLLSPPPPHFPSPNSPNCPPWEWCAEYWNLQLRCNTDACLLQTLLNLHSAGWGRRREGVIGMGWGNEMTVCSLSWILHKVFQVRKYCTDWVGDCWSWSPSREATRVSQRELFPNQIVKYSAEDVDAYHTVWLCTFQKIKYSEQSVVAILYPEFTCLFR